MTTLVQQEQRRDLLKELEQERLVQIARPSQPGPTKLWSPVSTWLGRQMVAWGQKLQPSTPEPAGCCIRCPPQGCTPANISAC